MTKYDFQAFEEGIRKKLAESDFESVDALITLARGVLEEVVLEKLLTTKEAATYLGVSLSTVQKMIQRRAVSAHKRGRDWFIKESDLALAMKSRPKGSLRKGPRFVIPRTYVLPR